MISVGNNKAVICKGDFHPTQLYKGDKKIAGYSLEEFQGTDKVTLVNCYNDKLYDVQIEGVNDAIITARGKNLFNICAEREVLKGALPNDSYVVEDGIMSFKTKFYDTSSTAFGLKVQVKKNTEYSFRYKTLTGRAYIRCFTSNGVQIKYSNSYTNFNFDSGDNEFLYFSFASNAWGTYTELTEMIIIESGEDNTFEPYTGYQTIPFENGEPTKDIPTFKGTTVIEVESDVAATISGKYKKVEG